MNTRRLLRVTGVLLLVSLLSMTELSSADQAPFPLAETGSYIYGMTTLSAVDQHREGKTVAATVWYPAVIGTDKEKRDAPADTSGAPYPLILYSHDSGSPNTDLMNLAHHLVSQGFVVVAPNHYDATATLWEDRQYDLMAVVEQLEDSELAAVIDMNHIGVYGYGVGGSIAVQMAGAHFDMESYRVYCQDKPVSWRCITPSLLEEGEQAAKAIMVEDENGMFYLPFEFEVKAAVAITPALAPIYGENGLAVATTPTLILGGAQVEAYADDAVCFNDHLGSADHAMISYLHEGAGLPKNKSESVRHFVTTFFGFHLQGKADYAQYLTEEAVNQNEGLVWGAAPSGTFHADIYTLTLNPNGTFIFLGNEQNITAGTYTLQGHQLNWVTDQYCNDLQVTYTWSYRDHKLTFAPVEPDRCLDRAEVLEMEYTAQ